MKKNRELVVSAVIIGIMIFMGTTQLGFINIGPISATLLHVPVLVGAILVSRKVGIISGLFFGLYSFIRSFTNPSPLSFIFMNPIISIIPRVLMPLIASNLYMSLNKIDSDKKQKYTNFLCAFMIFILSISLYISIIEKKAILFISLIIVFLVLFTIFLVLSVLKKVKGFAFLVATFTTVVHTIMVMGLVSIIYLHPASIAMNIDIQKTSFYLLLVSLTNGIPEAFIAGIILESLQKGMKKHDIGR